MGMGDAPLPMCYASSETQPIQQRKHLPVLFEAVLSAFRPLRGRPALICDATFGGGGHTVGLLESLPDARVVGMDQDPAAVERGARVVARFGPRFRLIEGNFETLGMDSEIRGGLDGALFDLGVSSFQFDDGSRGFSFREDAPIDMRMDTRQGRTGAAFLETATEAELVQAIRDFGEEKRWRAVVAAIVAARGTGVLQTTGGLAGLIEKTLGVMPAYLKGRRTVRKHPATLTFQGIRIAVNREIEVMECAIPQAFELLKPGGILAVISFHSLEDRFVKRYFRQLAGRPEHRLDSRSAHERQIQGSLLTTKAIQPDDAELASNPRSRSARLRVIQKSRTQD